ncbi:37 kDa salivary gland allergen Aed a 2-like [Anopheles bellator]|uniref:37 kDa salivary gland allergen Aed a 2-like n=1 Tax=Anopheles bellator TaxID=139047 RepID=UPI002648ED8B|nr:37 kDa salivary gland allergen Aed a 2-like [Anopheles bellator]
MQSAVRLSQHGPALLLLLALISSTAAAAAGDRADDTGQRDDGEGNALSPDDTLFAHLRCFERFASTQRSDRESDASDWLETSENYTRKTDRSPNFLKCVLTKLQLYDPQRVEFNTNILMQQYQRYGLWMNLSQQSLQAIVNTTGRIVLADASSEAIYAAFESIFRDHSHSYFQLFLRDPIVLGRIYQNKSWNGKKPNQTVIEFCEMHMSEGLWKEICLLRNYQISNRTAAMADHIDCVFKEFRYITVAGLIDESEILRDFRLVFALTEDTKTHVHRCVEESSSEGAIRQRSLRMYRCLLSGADTSRSFKEAFDFREVRSGNLSYILRDLQYDRDQVRAEILTLDRERCDDQQRSISRAQKSTTPHQ